jgi:hypothetical protein
MFNLSVVTRGGWWLLLDEAEGELGAFDSRAEALQAAGDFAVVDQEPRYVLVHDQDEWNEIVVGPPSRH